jgi:monoamine oxidase
MSLEDEKYDVVVIGGGFAGAVAARDLTEQGNKVLLLEARDRLGGRTWSTTFPGTDVPIEMGGQFIGPAENWPLTAHERQRYGIESHHLPAPECYRTVLNGVHNPGPIPVPMEQLYDLERAAIHCQQAAARIQPGMPLDQQGLDDLDIPLSDFLAPLGLPPETYEYVAGQLGLYMFRYPEECSALQPLVSLPPAT